MDQQEQGTERQEEPSTGEAKALDEELERLRRHVDDIGSDRQRRRRRLISAIVVGAMGAGLVSLVMFAMDKARNPCQRVRDHYCGQDPASPLCKSYDDILRESVEDTSPMARGAIRQQCETRITRLEVDEGIKVR